MLVAGRRRVVGDKCLPFSLLSSWYKCLIIPSAHHHLKSVTPRRHSRITSHRIASRKDTLACRRTTFPQQHDNGEAYTVQSDVYILQFVSFVYPKTLAEHLVEGQPVPIHYNNNKTNQWVGVSVPCVRLDGEQRKILIIVLDE